MDLHSNNNNYCKNILHFFSLLFIRKTIVIYLFNLALATTLIPIANAELVEPPLRESDVIGADAVVRGEFDVKGALPMNRETVANVLGDQKSVNCFIVPFKVQQSTVSIGKEVNVSVCFLPDGPQTKRWTVPLNEKLILFLKKDPTRNNTFDLVNPQTGWLLAPKEDFSDYSFKDPSRIAVEDSKNYLNALLKNSAPTLVRYYVGPDNLTQFLIYSQNDPALIRALQVGQNFAKGEADFISLAESYVNEPAEVGELARAIVAQGGNYDSLINRLHDFNAGKLAGNERFNFPDEVGRIIRSNNFKICKPLIGQAINSPDDRMRLAVVSSLRQGSERDETLYPLLVSLLRDPDLEIQYQAMGCIFRLSGSIKQRPGSRDLDLPTLKAFKNNPSDYIQNYLDWWKKRQPISNQSNSSNT